MRRKSRKEGGRRGQEGDKGTNKNEEEKGEKKIRGREEKGGSNIKDEASRSKNVICGRSKKRCLGFLRTPTNWMTRQIGSFRGFRRWGKIIIYGEK